MKEEFTHDQIRQFLDFNGVRLKFRDVIEAHTNGKYKVNKCDDIPDVFYKISDRVIEDANNTLLSESSDKKGKNVERLFEHASESFYDDNCRLKGSSYPDFRFEINGEVYYVELKTYQSKDKNSPQRYFYYASNKKIVSSGYHILVGFEHCNGNIIDYNIVDLYDLEVRLRSEVNAGNNQIYKNAG